MDTDEKIKAALILIGGSLIAVLAIFLITYRDTKTVTIDDRRWRYEVAVKYDVTTVSTSCTTNSKGSVSCSTTPHTTTYTRCRTGLQGNELPPVRPIEGCVRLPGDYISESIFYDVFYHDDSGTQGSSSFYGDQWNDLQPRHVAKLTTTAFNFVVGVEAK